MNNRTSPAGAANLWTPYKPSDKTPWNLRRVVHLHRRAGFAATWEELQRDLKDGPEASVDRLLSGKSRLRGVPADFNEAADTLERLAVREADRSLLANWWIYRILFSPDPLGERLTLFWHNYFATSAAKVGLTVRRQNTIFRRLARAPFGELLGKVVRDPALLIWLDAPANRKEHPNENLARELMELSGGNDGINTVVPYADDGYAKYRKHLRLPRNSLVRINDHIGLHGSFRNAGRLLDDGRLAIIQGVSYPNPSKSHFEGMAVWHSAQRDAAKHNGTGWLGRALEKGKSPADGSSAALYVGGGSTSAALRGEHSSPASLAQLDDLVLTTEPHPRTTLGPSPTENDVRAFVRRTMLDGYAAAERTMPNSSRTPICSRSCPVPCGPFSMT